MPSEWSVDQDESNHGLRFYLYCLCMFFWCSQGRSVEQRPTQDFQKFETRKMKSGARLVRPGGDTCSSFTRSGFQTVEHAGSVGKGLGFQSLKIRSPVRTMLGPIFYKVWFSLIFSYFFIFSYLFNIFHTILILFNIFIHALKIIKIFFPFAFIFRKCLFNL